MMKSNKRWAIAFLLVYVFLLGVLGGLTVWVDPYFHYHAPLSSLAYPIDNQRYQNDGIVKHFDYDAIIAGTSMIENFRTSEFDELFGVDSIKVPLEGASYREVNELLITAVEYNPDIRVIVRSMDYGMLMSGKDDMFYEEILYPRYLYDDQFYNDVTYFFNKSVFINDTLQVLNYTRNGGVTTTFDEYGYWADLVEYGEEAIGYLATEKVDTSESAAPVDYDTIEANLRQNIIDLMAEHPEIDFYLFFTPYSIAYWDAKYRDGTLEQQLDAEKYAIELLLECDNVHLFSFFTEYDMICDLDHYADGGHYGAEINSRILSWMSEGTHELTRENYMEYCAEEYAFYTGYDYDARFLNIVIE